MSNQYQNNSQPKKQYTLEDNVKYISFGIKDLVKQFEELNASLSQLISLMGQKKGDENNPLF